MLPDRLHAYLITDPFIILSTIFVGTISVASSLFDGQGRAQHKLAQVWGRMLCFAARVRLTVEGAEKVEPGRPYIFVANHASFMDIPVLLKALPVEMRFLAKKSLFTIPFMGWHLGRAGHVPVDLDDPRCAVRTLSAAAVLVRERGIPVLLFPEGGRVVKGLDPFKDGAAYLAIKSGATIIPVGVAGTRHILPMDRFFFIRPGPVTVRFGDPIPVAGIGMKQRESLTRRLRDAVAALLPEADGGTLDSSATVPGLAQVSGNCCWHRSWSTVAEIRDGRSGCPGWW